MSILTIDGLHKQFVRHLDDGSLRTVLRGVDLELQAGSTTVLRGPSGSGKSSLLRCIHRTYLPDSGSVDLQIDEQVIDLATATDRQVLDVRRSTMGMASQFLRVTPRVAAVDLVCEQGCDRPEAEELLGRLGLERVLFGAAPATFSGGERQLVNLAIAIARPRPLLLLDEATASLDPNRRARVLDVLSDIKERGVTVLAVFHDLPDTPGLIDRVVEMRDGRVHA